ncbi:glutathione S-transferase [Sphingorhabdus arenilitoris]|uniref:Glutathione S-transferase n=1 Tax=Sphingorhabdus arenilitoris TaxID=1490041 RepID=A0ABV8RFN1_9SPHN
MAIMANNLPILYSFRRCPYAMRARMALHISGTQLEHREILLRDKPDEMLATSPKGTVPVLVLPDGQILDESLDIMRWALAQNDPESWLKSLDFQLITGNDGSFKQALDRYKYPSRYNLDDPAQERDKAIPFLEELNRHLTQHVFLLGDRRGFTDIALFPFIRQFANTDRAWFDAQPMAGLQKWLAWHLKSPLFDAIMAKHPLWKSG